MNLGLIEQKVVWNYQKVLWEYDDITKNVYEKNLGIAKDCLDWVDNKTKEEKGNK